MLAFQRPPRYRVYVLRMWEERGGYADHSIVWRFSLEDPRTGGRHGFASIEALADYLRQQLGKQNHENPNCRPAPGPSGGSC